MKWFKGIKNAKELRKMYVKLSKENHPDCGGSEEVMKEINIEYAQMIEKLPKENPQTVFEVNVIPAELVAAVSTVVSIVNNSVKNAFLKMVELKATEENLTLKASRIFSNGQSMTITKTIPADVIKNADKVYITSKGLSIFSKLAAHGENLNLSYGENQGYLSFRNGKKENLATASTETNDEKDAKKYLPILEKGKSFTIKAADFKRLIDKVITAAATSANASEKYKGVLVEVEGNKIELTATDGAQFATIGGEILESAEKVKMLIPATALQFLTKTINRGILKVAYSDQAISFTCADTKIESTLIKYAEEYPIDAIRNLIPSELSASAIINKAELKKAITGVGVIAQAHEMKTIKFSFNANDGIIAIEGMKETIGAAKIYCSAVASSDTTATVNLDRINRALSGINDEYVMIGKATAGKNELLTIYDSDETFHYGIVQNYSEKDLSETAEEIEQIELDLAKKEEKIAEKLAEVSQAQKELKDIEKEIEQAEELVNAAKKALRQAKNALKKAEETQKDAETKTFRQQAIDKAESELKAAKIALVEKKNKQKELAEWIDSFPVQTLKKYYSKQEEKLARLKENHAKLQREDDWVKTIAA